MNARFKNVVDGVRMWGLPALIFTLLLAALVGIVYQFVETGPLDTTIEKDLEQAEETPSVASTPPAPNKQSSSTPAEQSSGGN